MKKLSHSSQAGKNPGMFELPQLWLPDRLRQRREDERLLRGRCGISRAWLPVDPCCCGPCDYIGLIRSYGAQEIHWEAGGGISVSPPASAGDDPRCTGGSMDFSVVVGSEEQIPDTSGAFSCFDSVECGPLGDCGSRWFLWWDVACDEEAEQWRLSATTLHVTEHCFDTPCSEFSFLYYVGATAIDLAVEDDGKVTGSYTAELTPDETRYVCPEGCSDICGDETLTLTVEFNP